MKKLLIFFIIAFVISSLTAVGFMARSNYWYDTALEQRDRADSIQTSEKEWRIKYILATKWTEEFQEKIESIEKVGHRPDHSLVYRTMKEFLNWPNLSWSELDSLFRMESGWGRDNRSGVFGEVNAAQVDTNTLKEELEAIGFEIIDFNPEDYRSVVSASEMSCLYTTRIKFLNYGMFDHVFYYNGFKTKMKKYNTAKFDQYMKNKGFVFKKGKWSKAK